jgi:probable H4MPT-linked C1 transfer pathway protein
MVNVIGLDVGGVNTKAAFVKTENGLITELKTATEYFPVWKRGREQLPAVLGGLRKRLVGSNGLDAVGATLTAELSDAYWTKREGVNHVLDCVKEVFADVPVFVLDVEANLRSVEEARKEPIKVASANWLATGWIVSRAIRDCIIIDVGSTTTSIIPVIDGEIAATGRNDLEKLLNGELVYTGSLRTNVAAIVSSIPIRGGSARVSSELFAQSGDVHLVLGNINEADYTVDTTDGRGKTRIEALARLGRVVCADIDMLTEQEITDIAKHVADEQIKQIAEGLKQVYDRIKPLAKGDIPVVVTGLGREFLARKAGQRAGFNRIINLGDFLSARGAVVSPSVGVAVMVASKLQGRTILWKQL